MDRLWLVRHCETEWSRARRHTGRTDLPLTPEGESRARAFGARLAGRPFGAVFSSPLLRARRTAELAGFPRPEQTELLREYDYGEYEGETTAAIRAARPGWELFHDGCPGGETAAEVIERGRRFCELAAARPGDVIAFTHGHISRAVACAFLGWPVTNAAGLANLDPCGLGLLEEGDGRLLLSWNGLPGDGTA